MSHKIAAVRFIPRTNDGPIDCDCGWSGQASEFAAHKGEKGGLFGYSRLRAGAEALAASPWTRCRPRGLAGGHCTNCGRPLIEKKGNLSHWAAA
jgi:hypothetical protein